MARLILTKLFHPLLWASLRTPVTPWTDTIKFIPVSYGWTWRAITALSVSRRPCKDYQTDASSTYREDRTQELLIFVHIRAGLRMPYNYHVSSAHPSYIPLIERPLIIATSLSTDNSDLEVIETSSQALNSVAQPSTSSSSTSASPSKAPDYTLWTPKKHALWPRKEYSLCVGAGKSTSPGTGAAPVVVVRAIVVLVPSSCASSRVVFSLAGPFHLLLSSFFFLLSISILRYLSFQC